MNILLFNLTKMVNDTGGMAKVTSFFANEMVNRGHSVSLIYSDEKSGEFYYPISNEVQCYDLRENSGKRIKFPTLMKIKRECLRLFNEQKSRNVRLEFGYKYLASKAKSLIDKLQPDVIVSFNPGSSAVLICKLNVQIPIITMSHGDTADYFNFYPEDSVQAVRMSTVNQVLLPLFKKHILDHIPNCKVEIIGNAIPQFDFSADLAADKSQYKIIFVGRLAKGTKRPHLLIDAFASLASKYPNWIVEMWGGVDGKVYYKELQMSIKFKNMESRIFLKGTTKDVPDKLRNADILAFPSAYEGFSLALGEGMSAGLPAIGYKNCPSVNEIIVDGENGLLCDDGVGTFAEALDKLMGDKELRVRMGKAAKEAMAAYAPERIWDQWEELLEKVVQER